MAAEITTKRVVYSIPGMEAATVRHGIEYSAGDAPTRGLTMHLYYPPGEPGGGLRPAVVLVLGYPDVGVALPLGCQFREMAFAISWGQLFAASGMVGVVYEASDPASNIHTVLSYIREHEEALGIDASRLGVWANSGNVPVALSAVIGGNVRCGVLCCGYMLDPDGTAGVGKAAAEYRFANPVAGRRVDEVPAQTALFIARAGREHFPGVNESIDAFVSTALRHNLPVTLVNFAAGSHGFELFDDTEESRQVVRAILAFLQGKLGFVPDRQAAPC